MTHFKFVDILLTNAQRGNCNSVSALITIDCPSLESNQMNNAAHVPTLVSQPYPGVGPIISPYEDPKDINKYTTLKAVGKRLFITNPP